MFIISDLCISHFYINISVSRFAFKQENFHNLGQWKKTEHSNPEWNKLAYSWPVRADGELNKVIMYTRCMLPVL